MDTDDKVEDESNAEEEPRTSDVKTLTVPGNDAQAQRSSVDSTAHQDGKEERPSFVDDLDVDHHVNWIKYFLFMKILLIIFGRWPITHSEDPHKRGYIFKFSWACAGSIIFVITFIFTLYGLLAASVNVVDILMTDKVVANRTKTQIIEQGLIERHTMILIIMLGSYGINALTSLFIFAKRHQISEMFTKWTQFLYVSKLNAGGGSMKTYTYVKVALGNYVIVCTIYIVLTARRESATFIGGPTVVAIIFSRQFFPANYLENFVGTSRHQVMHVMGIVIYFYVVTACNIYIYLFLWLLKSIENTFVCWNMRMTGVVEPPSSSQNANEEENNQRKSDVQVDTQRRQSYAILYQDHIGLVRMLSWFNNMFAYTLEPYVLFLTIKIVYQMYLAALVIKSNGKPLTIALLGKYFRRKGDYIPSMLLTYENCFMILVMLLASSWLEDTAYDSYDVLRKNSLLKENVTDKEAFFYLSMFQSYTSTTKMAVSGAQFFCIDRYTILHVLSAIMSNFLVVYQFAPLFDLDTEGYEHLRNTMADFLHAFEGLTASDTTNPVSDEERNRGSF